jgi:uncharacterized protein YdaU (DUF1376 family)
VGKHPWMPFYVADWLVGTAMLSPAEKGIYIDLLAFQWDNGSIPGDDVRALARVARCDLAEMEAAWPALRPKFTRSDSGGWCNARLEAERVAGDRLDQRNARGGRARAAAAARQGGKFQPNQPNHQPARQPSDQPPPANSQSQSHIQTDRRRGIPTLIQPRDLNAAAEGEALTIPRAWTNKIAARSNQRWTHERLRPFYAYAQRVAADTKPDLSARYAIFDWLDARFEEWREQQEAEAQSSAGRETVRQLREFEATFKAKQAGGAA